MKLSERLRGPLDLSFDAFVRTSADAGHRAGVERIWRAIGHDLYQRHYEGLYCVGCEQFYPAGPCPEGHWAPLQRVSEENWFFRLSRHQGPLLELIRSGRLTIEPAARRNEVLAFIEAGLEDISVSRSAVRSRGWGIPVPGDPSQVIYVWWDALANYITALDGDGYERWWVREPRKIHLMGKGVVRFHAVLWPAMLLSAGLPLPTGIFVHDYLTAAGQKISKSSGAVVDPVALVRAYGVDAVRWWLLREVPRVGDADFTEERLIARADEDLANGVGNLVHRVVTMVHRFHGGQVPDVPPERIDACERAPELVHEALAAFDFRRAAGAVWAIVEQANKYVETVQPWRQPLTDREVSLATLVHACRALAVQLGPFCPLRRLGWRRRWGRSGCRGRSRCSRASGDDLDESRPDSNDLDYLPWVGRHLVRTDSGPASAAPVARTVDPIGAPAVPPNRPQSRRRLRPGLFRLCLGREPQHDSANSRYDHMHDDMSAAPHDLSVSDEQIEQMLVSNLRRDLS